MPPGKLFSPHYLFIYVLNSDDKAVHKHQMGPYFIYCESDVGERQAASGRGFRLHRFILKLGSAVWWVARAADLFPRLFGAGNDDGSRGRVRSRFHDGGCLRRSKPNHELYGIEKKKRKRTFVS